MRIEKKEGTIETSNNFKEYSFGIKNKDMGLVLDILRSKMYTDPIGSICREVACNARDANREAGKDHVPIIITFSDNNDTITFQDKGPGISPERMADIFVNYGSSTKRENDIQTGGFGLGAKTPFSYTDSFNIVTIVDGKKYNYLAAIENQKEGKIYQLKVEDTDCENGTSIIIPIRERNKFDFEKACLEATYFWDIQPKYINFTYADSINAPALYHNNGVMVTKTPSFASAKYYLLVDKIIYPLENKFVSQVYNSSNVTCFLEFKTGELSLSATRENIHYDEKTTKIIKERINNIFTSVYSEIQNYISDSENEFQALVKFSKINSVKCKDYWDSAFAILKDFPQAIPGYKFNGKKLISNLNYNALNIRVVTQGNIELERTAATWVDLGKYPVYFIDKKNLSGSKNRTIFNEHDKFVAIEVDNKKILDYNEFTFSTKKKYVRLVRSTINQIKDLTDKGLKIKRYSEVANTKAQKTNNNSTTSHETTIYTKIISRRGCSDWDRYQSYPFIKKDGVITDGSGEPITADEYAYCVVPNLQSFSDMRCKEDTLNFVSKIHKVDCFFVNKRSSKHFEGLLKTVEELSTDFPTEILQKAANKNYLKSKEIDRNYFSLAFPKEIINSLNEFKKLKEEYSSNDIISIPKDILTKKEIKPSEKIVKVVDVTDKISKKYLIVDRVLNFIYSNISEELISHLNKYIKCIDKEKEIS